MPRESRFEELLQEIRPRVRELQQEVDSLEWQGLTGPELSSKLRELQYLQEREALGDLYVPLH